MGKGKAVAVGMSGGVDSSMTAALLKDAGYGVTGVFIDCNMGSWCRSDGDRKDALKVALQLSIPFRTIDLREAYRKRVWEYFVESYRQGLTPNPDVVCNEEIKFGLFYDWATGHGFDYVATGHYARIGAGEALVHRFPNASVAFPKKVSSGFSGQFLMRGIDQSKDQSYFLYRIKSEQLSHILFPLGDKTKEWVRAEAKRRQLPVADKPDSMGVCFVGEFDLGRFLREELGEKPGEVVYRGTIVGKHRGLWFYTTGQRAGGLSYDTQALRKLGLDPASLPPLYVTAKERTGNRLQIGSKEETYQRRMRLGSVHWLVPPVFWDKDNSSLYVRIRNLGELHPARITGEVLVETGEPVMGVAEGQSAVLYLGTGVEGDEVVVGGGVIQ